MAAPATAAGERGGPMREVASYYASRLAAHGATPLGVDWTCQPTQELRFVQLLKLCDFSAPLSLNDLGCGYGALRGFLRQRWPRASIDYHGVDLVPEMVEAASSRFGGLAGTAFEVGDTCRRIADYSVASGIFNVKLDQPVQEWEGFVANTLRDLAHSSRRGFAVNFLRAGDAGHIGIPQLYRTEPGRWERFCEAELGVSVETRAAYGMREFTLLARR